MSIVYMLKLFVS